MSVIPSLASGRPISRQPLCCSMPHLWPYLLPQVPCGFALDARGTLLLPVRASCFMAVWSSYASHLSCHAAVSPSPFQAPSHFPPVPFLHCTLHHTGPPNPPHPCASSGQLKTRYPPPSVRPSAPCQPSLYASMPTEFLLEIFSPLSTPSLPCAAHTPVSVTIARGTRSGSRKGAQEGGPRGWQPSPPSCAVPCDA